MPHTPPQKPWPPRGLTGLLVRLFMRGYAPPEGLEVRSRAGVLQGGVSIIVNLLLFVIKGIIGLMLGSVALLADAVHSLSDIGSSLVIIVGYLWARKPGDRRHPFGHGRVEFVTALVMAVLLIVAAIEFARFGIARILSPQPYTAPWWAIAAVVLTIILKQWLSIFADTLARATKSDVLKADYWHHVTDVASSALVLVALLASRAGWHGVDGWAGVGVAVFILWAAIGIARGAISPLLGEAPRREEVKQIDEAARSVPGIKGVHDIIVHQYGDLRIVSLHVEVDAEKSAMDVHDLSERAEAAVEGVTTCKAIVHVDPVDRNHSEYDRAERMMEDLVRGQESLAEFHDLRVEGPTQRMSISVDVVAKVGTDEKDYPEIEQRVCRAIREAMGEGASRVRVTVEKAYHGHQG